MPELTLDNLVAGLETFADRYHALDVFMADVAEIRALADGVLVDGLFPDPANAEALLFQRDRWYRLQLYPADGVARLTRVAAEVPPDNAAGPAVLGGVLGALIGSGTGLLLGLLVGAALGAPADAPPARRVFALCFDPARRDWVAYDGGLVRWMKERLAPPQVVDGLPR